MTLYTSHKLYLILSFENIVSCSFEQYGIVIWRIKYSFFFGCRTVLTLPTPIPDEEKKYT